jgi:hypothetical protein
LLFSFSLLLASRRQIIGVATITCNRRRSCRTWDYAARAFSINKQRNCSWWSPPMTLSCQKVNPLLIMTSICRRCCRCFLFTVARSKGKSTCDYDWYSPPLLSLFSFSLKKIDLSVLLVIPAAAVALVIMPLERANIRIRNGKNKIKKW